MNPLERAVIRNDAEELRELLKENAWLEYVASCMSKAMAQNNVEIIKLLLQHGFTIEEDFLDYIFSLKNEECTKEIVVHIVKHNNRGVKPLYKIFIRLLKSNLEKSSAVDILNTLLDYGMPLEDYIDDYCCNPLHCCLLKENVNLATSLLRRGADVNKKTLDGRTILLSSIWFMYSISPLQLVCVFLKDPTTEASLLMRYGVDLNILNGMGETPLQGIKKSDMKVFLVKELALLKYQGKFICNENLKHLREQENLQKIFNECLDELKIMESQDFYSGYSMYDIIKGRYQALKMTLMTKNKELVAAFRRWNRESFKYYGKDLDEIFEEATERREILLSAEKKLKSVFKDYHLPELVVHEIAYFINENLFVKYTAKPTSQFAKST